MSDGGPAFPVVINSDHEEHDSGMSLRDWFAGQALVSLCAIEIVKPESAATIAYQMADAMLAQRGKGKEE